MDLYTLTTYLTLLAANIWISRTFGEIRCYCNEPRCIISGYMCKSSVGRCYSRSIQDGSTSRSTRGCVESLDDASVQHLCINGGGVVKTKKASRADWPILKCVCNTDMCNYVDGDDDTVGNDMTSNRSVLKKDNKKDSVEIVNIPAKYLPENSRADGASSQTDSSDVDRLKVVSRERDVWFKAAVIAVPIAGGFILVLLVLLAVRMLRTDHRHERASGTRKAQLFVAGQTFDVCRNKSNLVKNAYTDVHISIDPKSHPYEKLHTTRIAENDNNTETTKDSYVVWKMPDLPNDSSAV